MHYASTFSEAATLMRAEQAADVLVVAVGNRDADALEFLGEMKKAYPRTVRFSVSSTSEGLLSLQSSSIAHQCLEKPYDVRELEILITRASTLRERLQGCALRERLHELDGLPALPALYERIIEEINCREPSLASVAALLREDVSLSAKLLQIVNSAAIGLRHQVSDITHAATLLGLEKLSSLVLAVEVFSVVGEDSLPCGLSLDALWSHSLKVAEFSRTVAREACNDQKAIDASFTAGLLHDIGMILLAANFPDELAASLTLAKSEGKTLWESERDTFATTHAEIGGYLLALWGLPDPIVEAITYHDSPSTLPEEEYPSGIPEHGFTPLTAVHVANCFCSGERQAAYGCVEGEIDSIYLERVGFSERLDDWFQACQQA